MANLITSIMLRNPKSRNKEIIGDIFLIKLYNKLEDARELSATINACSRLGRPDVALQFCMEIPRAKKKAEQIRQSRAQWVVTACENCKTQIDDLNDHYGLGIEVKGVVDLVADALVV